MKMDKIRKYDSQLWCAVTKALKDCIVAHGPIGLQDLPDSNRHDSVGSAAKRIICEIINQKCIENMVPNDVKMMIAQMGARKSKLRTRHERHLEAMVKKMGQTIKKIRAELKQLRNKWDDQKASPKKELLNGTKLT
jgi:hypothetical protein